MRRDVRLLLSSLPVACLLPLLPGCPPTTTEPACVPPAAVYTDIDETLTTSDSEWLTQLGDASHDPAERPDAQTLMQGYADLGYTIFYITARGEELALEDGRSAREATDDWLDGHGYPRSEGDLFLAEGIGAIGSSAVTYKAGVVDDLEAAGWVSEWAYGNAESDIEGFQQAGIPDERIFLVGELAGTMGVNPISDDDAYSAHFAGQLGQLEEQTCDE